LARPRHRHDSRRRRLRPFVPWPMGPNLPRMLQGQHRRHCHSRPAPIQKFSHNPPRWPTSLKAASKPMYAQTVDRAFARPPVRKRLKPLICCEKSTLPNICPRTAPTIQSPPSDSACQQIALMIKANIGLEVMFSRLRAAGTIMSMKAGTQGQLANLLRDLSQSLAAFYQDMGDRMGDVGNGHDERVRPHRPGKMATAAPTTAHANCMFVMGGDVKGGPRLWQMARPQRPPTQRRARPRSHHRFFVP